ncbi:MAG: TIGR03943 family protein [Micromonosporaceae bacterium]|nr:TIGR03943 family protein [Micromonosporaceae bacterium]
MVLLLAGGTLVKLAATGASMRYVRAGMRPVVLTAGLVLLAVAALSLAHAVRARRTANAALAGELGGGDQVGEHGDRHDHGHRFEVAWLLVVPMLVLLLLAPQPLGSYSAARAGTALGAARSTDFVPLPAGDPIRVSLLDYAARAVFDPRALAGRHVVLSGFVLPGPHGAWYLTRMVITCCAADAQPIKVGLSGTVPAGLRSNDWIEVTGGYTSRTATDEVNAETIPFIEVNTSRPIAAPSEQYVS